MAHITRWIRLRFTPRSSRSCASALELARATRLPAALAGALSRQVAWLRDAWLSEVALQTRDQTAAEQSLSFLQEIDPDLALSGLDRARCMMPGSRWWRARGDLLLACKRFGKPDPDAIA